MASNFFNNTISQVGTMQVGIPTEVRVGSRTVQIKGKLAEGNRCTLSYIGIVNIHYMFMFY